jgi:EpsI family protein
MLVADACSGLNSLYSLFALGLLYAHLTGPSRPARIAILLVSVIPIAVIANILRVLALVLVTYHWGAEVANGWFHDVVGMAVFVLAFGLMVVVDKAGGTKREAREKIPAPRVSSLLAPRTSRLVPMAAFAAMMGAAVAVPALTPVARPSSLDLERLIPAQFAGWRIDPDVVPIAPTPDVQARLDRIYGQTVSRAYVNDAGEQMMLTVAYGGDQSDALKAHRQEVCYTAQGFEIHGLHHARLSTAGRTIPVTRMLAMRGERAEPVTYWFTMGDRVVLGRFERLRAQLASGLSGRVPDGMLVRVSSISPDAPRAFGAQESFIAALLAAMPASQTVRFVGASQTQGRT